MVTLDGLKQMAVQPCREGGITTAEAGRASGMEAGKYS